MVILCSFESNTGKTDSCKMSHAVSAVVFFTQCHAVAEKQLEGITYIQRDSKMQTVVVELAHYY